MFQVKHLVNSIIGFIILIVLWQLIIMIGQYESALFPSPLQVGQGLLNMIRDGSLFMHLKVSLGRFLTGYVLAVISAVLLGLILSRLPALWAIVDPITQVIRPISPIAWSPFIVL